MLSKQEREIMFFEFKYFNSKLFRPGFRDIINLILVSMANCP